MKLLVFGSLNIDDVYRVNHLVKEGETMESRSYQRCEGGKGLNQAIALAKAGADVYMAGAVGADGTFLLDFLSSFGVHTEYMRTLSVPTGRAIIQVDDEGRNAILLYGGANRCVTPEIIDGVLGSFGEDDWILLQNEISGVDYLINAASGKGMTVLLNPSPLTEELKRSSLQRVDWFILNEVEGYGFTGKTGDNDIVADMLSQYPSSRVLLTLGERGAVYADVTQRVWQDAIRSNVQDTTGAGDTFTGYFIHSILTGNTIERAMRIASHAASIAISRMGAGRSIPYADEVMLALGSCKEQE